MSDETKTRILILGGGFGGLYAAMRLDKTLAKDPNCEVVLVNEQNYSLFTPMLHEVAASDIDPTDIVNPFRKLLKRVTFFEAAVKHIDLDAKAVTIGFGLRKTRVLEYDQLLIAIGSETKFFDEETRVNALQMKRLGDAILLRNQMIGLLESASIDPDEAANRRRLCFVIAGGGFAGVETIGAMNDFLRGILKYYPRIDSSMLRIVLVHPLHVLLPEFHQSLGEYTGERLKDAGIEVMLDTKVERFDGQCVKLSSGDSIPTATLVWTAGVVPSKLIQDLPVEKVKGRVVADATMAVKGRPGVWIVGDSAFIPDPTNDNKPYPATAQHAMRQGKVVARNIEATIRNRPEKIKPFKYKMLGQLAAIGRRRGAAQVFGVNFSGFIAWWLWRTVYLMKLPRFEKKLRVALGWTLDLFFKKDVVQIINVSEIERFTEIGTKRLKFGQQPIDARHDTAAGQAEGAARLDSADGHAASVAAGRGL